MNAIDFAMIQGFNAGKVVAATVAAGATAALTSKVTLVALGALAIGGAIYAARNTSIVTKIRAQLFNVEEHIALAIVNKTENPVKFLSNRQLNNPKVAQKLVEKDGLNFIVLSEKNRPNWNLFETAYAKTPDLIDNLMKTEKGMAVLSDYVKDQVRRHKLEKYDEAAARFKNLPEVIKAEKKLVIVAVKQNSYVARYLSNEQKKDRAIAEAAVGSNGFALMDFDESLQRDQDLFQEAVRTKPTYAKYAKFKPYRT